MRSAGLAKVLKRARGRGLRPFEIFAEGKSWLDGERLKQRGVVVAIEERAREDEELRQERGQVPAGAKRGPRSKKTATEDEAVGVRRDLGFARHAHSHLLELRRAAIKGIFEKEREREEAGERVQA